MFLLQIDYEKSASPASIGIDPSDHRELAVFFRSLTIAWRGFENKLDFANPESLRRNGLFGFWSPEVDGVWSAGRRSAFAFEIPEFEGSGLLRSLGRIADSLRGQELIIDVSCLDKLPKNDEESVKTAKSNSLLPSRSTLWPTLRLLVLAPTPPARFNSFTYANMIRRLDPEAQVMGCFSPL
jgi:hypothetical protein